MFLYFYLSILTLIVVYLPQVIIVALQYSYLVLAVMLRCCFWTVKHRHQNLYFISDILLHSVDIYLP